jgi:formylmethanofuran dehydrogenase subunit E
MSTAYVKVPDTYLEEARLLLDVPEEVDEADIVICANCESEIILNDDEWKQGFFVCPECNEQVSIPDIDADLD